MADTKTMHTYVYKYVLAHPEYFKYIEPGFFEGVLDVLFRKVKAHYETYNNVPTEATLIELCRNEIDTGAFDEESVRAVSRVDISEVDLDWLKNYVRDWIRQRRLYLRLAKAGSKFKNSEEDLGSGEFGRVVNEVTDLVNDSRNIDFDFQPGLDFFDAASHRQEKADKIASPYAYLNRVTQGGYDNKTLNIYLGASNVGKCVTGDTEVIIRHDATGEIFTIKIGDFYKFVKESDVLVD